MLKHQILLFFRKIRHNKATFLINVIGLSIGLTAVLIIYTWTSAELRVDKFFASNDNLVQILQNVPGSDGITTWKNTPSPLARAMASEFPEVKQAVTVLPFEWFAGSQFILSDGGDQYVTSRNQFASEDYFQVFAYPLMQGKREALLEDINSVVISENLARKLFGNEDAIDKTLLWVHNAFGGTYTVSGVFKLPDDVSSEFDAVFNYEIIDRMTEGADDWDNSNPYTYLVLAGNTNLNQFNDKVEDFITKKVSDSKTTLFAQKYADTYLYDRYENGAAAGGKIDHIKLFIIISALILIIACVNFMNLSTAKASTRVREIGLKKTLGIKRNSLFGQFLLESMITAFISLCVAIGAALLLLPKFSILFGKQIALTFSPTLVLGFLGVTVFAGILAGIYPALHMSGFSPVNALRGISDKGKNAQPMRKALVVFQFTIATILILSIVVIYEQIRLVQTKNLGYNKDNLITFTKGVRAENDTSKVHKQEETIERFLMLLKNVPGIVNASQYAYFMDNFGTTEGVSWPGKDPNIDAVFANIAAGYDFIETTGMQMKLGRSYSREISNEISKIIFNETAIEAMGIKDPIGKKIYLWGDEREIIGVVKDFHFERIYEKIKPLFINLTTGDFASQVIVKLDSKGQDDTIERVEGLYKEYFVGSMPFEFKFLEEKYQKLYEREKRAEMIARYGAATAIFVASIGLFGLAVFSTQRRKREIGIRKVLGQSSSQIALLVSREFLSLVAVSIVIGLPTAYFFMASWLSEFAYRIDLKIQYFVMAGVAVLLIALLTVSFQSLQAAHKNPVDSLREQA